MIEYLVIHYGIHLAVLVLFTLPSFWWISSRTKARLQKNEDAYQADVLAARMEYRRKWND